MRIGRGLLVQEAPSALKCDGCPWALGRPIKESPTILQNKTNPIKKPRFQSKGIRDLLIMQQLHLDAELSGRKKWVTFCVRWMPLGNRNCVGHVGPCEGRLPQWPPFEKRNLQKHRSLVLNPGHCVINLSFGSQIHGVTPLDTTKIHCILGVRHVWVIPCQGSGEFQRNLAPCIGKSTHGGDKKFYSQP